MHCVRCAYSVCERSIAVTGFAVNGTLLAMAAPTGQQFLNELDKRPWTAADRLRSSLDTDGNRMP